MSTKSFLFIGSWMQPIKALPLQERWNVMEAIVEYSISGTLSKSLSMMENIAFGFIRNEIDRMKQRRSEVCEKRRAAANTRWRKVEAATTQTDVMSTSNELPDANACKVMQSDAPYHIESSVSESVSESKSESEKKSSTSSGVRVRVNAGKETPYDDSQLHAEPLSVMQKDRPSPSGNNHDFNCLGPPQLSNDLTRYVTW